MLLEVELRPTRARKITCVMQVYLTETPLCGNFLVVSSGTSFDSLDRVICPCVEQGCEEDESLKSSSPLALSS
jgi:hypothetical protein